MIPRSVVSGEEWGGILVTVLENAFTSTLNGGRLTNSLLSQDGRRASSLSVVSVPPPSARSPLIIVDNVERDLSFLDAYPIESITVLKDAAASSIYGMCGANGVISWLLPSAVMPVKTKIDFTQEVGFQTLANKMEVQNSYNMAMTRNQVRYLSGMDPMYTQEQLDNYKVCMRWWKVLTMISASTSTSIHPPWADQLAS